MLRCAVGGERWVVVGVVVMVGVEVVVLVGLAVVVAMAWFLFFSKDIFFFSSKIGGKKKMAPPPKNVARNAAQESGRQFKPFTYMANGLVLMF